jgi:hypothetical protein
LIKGKLKSQSPHYSVIVGFDTSRKLWFAQLYDKPGVTKPLMIDINLVKGKEILKFVKMYADPKCPYVKKLKDTITNNLDPKDIFN